MPFGLPAWSDDAALAMAVLLDLPASDLGDVAAVASRLPSPSTLPARALVVVLGEADGSEGVLGRLFRVRRARVLASVRGSALLVRGFTRIGGSADGDLVWGFVSSP